LTEIEIKNFQSIKKLKFPIEGFTVIYGKNNSGKSAIIRAIRAALTNQTGKGFIRKSEKETEIKIKRDDLNILWKKGTKAVYTINKETYQNLNRDIPKPLIDAGFEKMDIGKKKVLPTIASQFNPLFLIDEHGTTITEVLASLYNIDTLSIADELCQKSLRSQKSLLKTREKDLDTLQVKLEKYKDFEDIKKEVDILLEQEKKINALESETTEIAAFEKNLIRLYESLKKIKPIQKIEIPDVSKHEKDFTEIQELITLGQEYSKRISVVEQLKNIALITLPSTKGLEQLSEEVRLLTEWDEALTTLEKRVKQKNDLLKKLDLTGLTKSYKELKIICEEIIILEDLEKEFMSIVKSAKETREEFRKVSDEYNEKYKELSTEICPTCERPYGD